MTGRPLDPALVQRIVSHLTESGSVTGTARALNVDRATVVEARLQDDERRRNLLKQAGEKAPVAILSRTQQ